jgi:hypothetical protein
MRVLLSLVLSVFGFFVASTAMAAALAIHIGEYYVAWSSGHRGVPSASWR